MVLLVVDTQDLIMTSDLHEFDTLVENLKSLIATARNNNCEVIYIRHDDGVELTESLEGFNIYSEFAPKDNEKIFNKNFNSAFKNTGLHEYLQGRNEKQIMIVGLMTNYCIDATIKVGFELGYEMIIPEDCNSTESNQFMSAEATYNYYNKFIWAGTFGKSVAFEEAVDLLKN